MILPALKYAKKQFPQLLKSCLSSAIIISLFCHVKLMKYVKIKSYIVIVLVSLGLLVSFIKYEEVLYDLIRIAN